jgi:hypothetical protein
MGSDTDCSGIAYSFPCRDGAMRSSRWFPLLLALVVPSAAWSGPLDSPRPATARPASVRAAESADPAVLCETAITTAEYIGRLPPRLLGAIGLTETGRVDPATGSVRPWPWTINAEGQGQFFETKAQAIAAVKALQARGVQSIDIGCLQVNLMYHPDAFATLEDAFDPRTNAAYAARFLNALYADGRDWARAIAAYHSETPALGDAYRVLVMARWQNGDLRAVAPPATTAYQDFVRRDAAYGAFAPASRVYGAFAGPDAGR